MKTINLNYFDPDTAKILFVFILVLFTTLAFSQTQKVVRVDNATVRMHIENFTQQYTFPDVIKFVQDANGNWVTSIENFQNIRYVGIRADLREYFIANGIQTDVRSLKEALERWGVIIDYAPPANTESQ